MIMSNLVSIGSKTSLISKLWKEVSKELKISENNKMYYGNVEKQKQKKILRFSYLESMILFKGQ